MDLYHITLFLHVVTLVVAASVTAITKLAAGRRMRARTVGEMLEWHNVLMSAAKVFPICLVAFLITGGYMVSVAHVPWSSGFVVAGVTGIVLLFASGTFLGIKGKGLAQMLDNLAKKGADLPAPTLIPPPLVAALPVINTAIALAVVFAMATKPTSIPAGLAIVTIGIAIGAVMGMRRPALAQANVSASRGFANS